MTIAQLDAKQQDSGVQDLVEAISGLVEQAFTILIERRDTAYAAAIAPLDAEQAQLQHEYAAIGKAAQSLAELLPAQARVAQAEHDRLLLAGDREGAVRQLVQQREAERAPDSMKRRQAEIFARLEMVESEKKAIAKRIFEAWYAEVQQVIRASERGLFINLLDKVADAMYAYQSRHDLGPTLDKPYSTLVTPLRLSNLTAPENTIEWKSGSRWYSGRRT